MSIPKDTMDTSSIAQKLSVSNKTFLAGFDWCWKNVIEGIAEDEKMKERIMECVKTSRERMVETMIANAEESREKAGE